MSEFFSSILESAPSVPKLPTVSLTEEQKAALAANVGILPGTQALASDINRFNQTEWLKAMKFAFPQFEQARDTITGNAFAMSRGEIPQSDLQRLQIRDAAKAFSGGYSGSGMAGYLTARDLGLAQLEVMQRGQNALQSWINSIRTPNPFDVTSMFITPTQLYQTKNEQNLQQFQRKYASSVMDSHYSWSSRIGRGLDSALDIVLSLYGGGMMGGGGKTGGTGSSGSGGQMGWYDFG